MCDIIFVYTSRISRGSNLLRAAAITRCATERRLAANAEATRVGAGTNNNKVHSKQSEMKQAADTTARLHAADYS